MGLKRDFKEYFGRSFPIVVRFGHSDSNTSLFTCQFRTAAVFVAQLAKRKTHSQAKPVTRQQFVPHEASYSFRCFAKGFSSFACGPYSFTRQPVITASAVTACDIGGAAWLRLRLRLPCGDAVAPQGWETHGLETR